MCGIVVLSGAVPLPVTAMAIAGAGARGPHTHGWATSNDSDGWTVLRFPGRLVYGTLPSLYATHIKDIYIGHSRLATSGSRAGDVPAVAESQPYVASGTYLVAHNGTIPDAISRRKRGEVDTQALLRGLEAGSAPVAMLWRAGLPQAVVWAVEASVYASRINGKTFPAHPFYVARGKDWLAASSGPIPGGKLLPAGIAVRLI